MTLNMIIRNSELLEEMCLFLFVFRLVIVFSVRIVRQDKEGGEFVNED